MFDVIVPIPITDAILTSSSVAEDDAPEYDAGTSYAVDDEVIITSLHSVFRSVSGSNLGNDPETDGGSNWVMLGATNRWSAFDKQIQNAAIATSSITYTLEPGDLVTAVCLFGLIGSEATLTVTKDAEVYSYTKSLVSRPGLTGWFSWFFGAFAQQRTVLFDNLPYLGPDAIYTITVTAPSSAVGIGQIVLGRQRNVGKTRWGAEIGIVSASRKDRDIYLNWTIVKRATARRVKFPILVLDRAVSQVVELMRELDAEPAVWIGDSDETYGLIVYGLYFDYVHQIDLPNKSEFTVIVEELK